MILAEDKTKYINRINQEFIESNSSYKLCSECSIETEHLIENMGVTKSGKISKKCKFHYDKQAQEYYSRPPEIKEKTKQQKKEYNKGPEVKERNSTKRNYCDTSIHLGFAYVQNCEIGIVNMFPTVSVVSLRKQLQLYNYHFIPTVEAVKKLFEAGSPQLVIIKTKRYRKYCNVASAEFVEEYAHYLESLARASKINETQYEREGQGIECGCCYESVPFESLVQCNEGHLFCNNCIKDYVEKTVFGEERNDIHCIDFQSNCKEGFPEASIRSALTKETFEKYKHMIQMIDIKKANLPGLKHCKHCDYMYVMDPEDTVFYCRGCGKNTCLLCEGPNHLPKPCPKKETPTEEATRKEAEEELTRERLRECYKCRTKFIKTEGCNKVTCTTCKVCMCYVCRTVKIDYNHFCACKEDRKEKQIKTCDKCRKCILFFKNTEKIDESDIDRLKKEKQKHYFSV